MARIRKMGTIQLGEHLVKNSNSNTPPKTLASLMRHVVVAVHGGDSITLIPIWESARAWKRD